MSIERERIEAILSGTSAPHYPAPDGWYYENPRADQNGKDARKLVVLAQGGMRWVGVRAWHAQGRYWMNNGEPERGVEVTAWRDLPAIADGRWVGGKLIL